MDYKEEPLKYGANSSREEALIELNMENAEQQNLNNIFGGSRGRNKYTRKNNPKYRKNKSERIIMLKNKRKIVSLIKKKKELKIIINKIKRHLKNKSMKNKSMKNKSMKNKSMKNKSMKNKRYYGGEQQQFEVPQFHGSSGANSSSIELNGLILKAQQDSLHDE